MNKKTLIGIGLLALGACSPTLTAQAPVRETPRSMEYPLSCSFEGRSNGILHVQNFPVLWAQHVPATAELHGDRLRTQLNAAGWHVSGEVDASEVGMLAPVEATWLAEGVGVTTNAVLRVIESEPGRVQVGLDRSGIAGLPMLIDPPTRWMDCAMLSLDARRMSPARARQALSQTAPSGFVEIGLREPLSLSARLGADPFLTLQSGWRVGFDVLGRAGDAYQLTFTVDGVVYQGWAQSTEFAPAVRPTGVLAGRVSAYEECRLVEPATLEVMLPGGFVNIGQLDGGAHYIRVATYPDGAQRIRPPASGELAVFDDQVELRIRPAHASECTRHPEVRRLHTRFERFDIRVMQVEGLEAVHVGDLCELRLDRRIDVDLDQLARCTVGLGCGATMLFGTAENGASFPCARVDGILRGEDDTTTGEDGYDGTLSLDFGDMRITAADDETGRLGAFRFEGTVLPHSEAEGSLAESQILPVVDAHSAETDDCFARGAENEPGQVALQFTVSPAGRVQDISVQNTTFDNPWLQSCLLRRAAQWTFPSHSGRATFVHPLVWNGLSNDDISGPGRLSLRAIFRPMSAHRHEVYTCIRRAARSGMSVGGRIMIRFVISESGAVEEAEVEESTVDQSSSLAACVARQVRTWVFEAPEGGSVTVRRMFQIDSAD